MKFTFGIFIALYCTTSFAVDSTYQQPVYIKQGGAELNVKTGGMIKVRDTNLHQIPVVIVGIEGTNVGRAVAPYAGTVSSIGCMSDTEINDTSTVLTAAINGTNITGGAVTISSVGTVLNTISTVTPSAANTVAAGNAITVTSDGGTNTTANGYCILYITP